MQLIRSTVLSYSYFEEEQIYRTNKNDLVWILFILIFVVCQVITFSRHSTRKCQSYEIYPIKEKLHRFQYPKYKTTKRMKLRSIVSSLSPFYTFNSFCIHIYKAEPLFIQDVFNLLQYIKLLISQYPFFDVALFMDNTVPVFLLNTLKLYTGSYYIQLSADWKMKNSRVNSALFALRYYT